MNLKKCIYYVDIKISNGFLFIFLLKLLSAHFFFQFMEAIAEWEPYFQKDMLILVGKHLLVYLYFENLIATDIAGNRDMNIVIEAERDIWQRSESLILQSSKCSRDRVRSLNMDGRIPGDRGNKHPGRSREQPGALSK